MNLNYKIITALSLMLFAGSLNSCKKLVEVDPPTTSIQGSATYTSDATAISVLNGLYSTLSNKATTAAGNVLSLSFFGGLSADEYSLISTVTSTGWLGYYQNALSAGSFNGIEFWNTIYSNLYTCNDAISGLTGSTSLTPAVKQQLLGEAKFMRAFFYFYLVNLYGDVPLVLTTDYTTNAQLYRLPKSAVWTQIISDLKDAEELLADGYVNQSGVTLYTAASAERVRPNKYAAAALLARAYLYNADNVNAEVQASIVINNSTYYGLTTLNTAFLKNSREAIWQLQPVNVNFNTPDAQFFIYPTNGGPTASNPVYLSSSLLSSFEPNDARKTNGNWINSMTIGTTTYYFPYKYKVYLSNTAVTSPSALTEYEMILRLGEQYLIRAEARAQQNNISGAQADLNAIRTRAGLSNTTASTQAALLTAILHERQVELFSEIGQRWLDLKRTNTVDAVMSLQTPLKGGIWQSYQQLYPVSITDITRNRNLTQNAGY